MWTLIKQIGLSFPDITIDKVDKVSVGDKEHLTVTFKKAIPTEIVKLKDDKAHKAIQAYNMKSYGVGPLGRGNTSSNKEIGRIKCAYVNCNERILDVDPMHDQYCSEDCEVRDKVKPPKAECKCKDNGYKWSTDCDDCNQKEEPIIEEENGCKNQDCDNLIIDSKEYLPYCSLECSHWQCSVCDIWTKIEYDNCCNPDCKNERKFENQLSTVEPKLEQCPVCLSYDCLKGCKKESKEELIVDDDILPNGKINCETCKHEHDCNEKKIECNDYYSGHERKELSLVKRNHKEEPTARPNCKGNCVEWSIECDACNSKRLATITKQKTP